LEGGGGVTFGLQRRADRLKVRKTSLVADLVPALLPGLAEAVAVSAALVDPRLGRLTRRLVLGLGTGSLLR
jgi:hypothetical protein